LSSDNTAAGVRQQQQQQQQQQQLRARMLQLEKRTAAGGRTEVFSAAMQLPLFPCHHNVLSPLLLLLLFHQHPNDTPSLIK
jgi:hypothetical protein